MLPTSQGHTCQCDKGAERKTPDRQRVQVAHPKAVVEHDPAARLDHGHNHDGRCHAKDPLDSPRDTRCAAHDALPPSCRMILRASGLKLGAPAVMRCTNRPVPGSYSSYPSTLVLAPCARGRGGGGIVYEQ